MLNQLITFPVPGSGVTAAIQASVETDEAVLFGTNGPNNSDVVLTQLSAPVNVAISQGGTAGTTDYSYLVYDASAVGVVPSAAASTTSGSSTLTATNFNIITWSTIPGHIYYVCRSASSGTPASTGVIGGPITASLPTLANPAGQTQATFDDTGIAATLNVPTVNTTGSLTVPGPIFASGVVTGNFATSSITSTGALTWTVANMTAGMLIRAGSTGSAVSDVTPTAAALVAAFKGAQAGQGYKFWFKNTTGFNVSVTGGTGVTVTGTAAVSSVFVRELAVVFENVTPGTESVTVFTGPESAY